MRSGQTGSQAPHNEQASSGAARSEAFAPHWRALASPSGVNLGSWLPRHIGHTRKHKLHPLQAVKSRGAAGALAWKPNIRKSRPG